MKGSFKNFISVYKDGMERKGKDLERTAGKNKYMGVKRFNCQDVFEKI